MSEMEKLTEHFRERLLSKVAISERERWILNKHRRTIQGQADVMADQIRKLEASIAEAAVGGVMVSEATCIELFKARHQRREFVILLETMDRVIAAKQIEGEGSCTDNKVRLPEMKTRTCLPQQSLRRFLPWSSKT